MTYDDRSSKSRVIRTARRLNGVDLTDLREFFLLSRFHKLIANPSHPACMFFEPLPLGKRYRSLGYNGMSS